jgi:hypothetical protein
MCQSSWRQEAILGDLFPWGIYFEILGVSLSAPAEYPGRPDYRSQSAGRRHPGLNQKEA